MALDALLQDTTRGELAVEAVSKSFYSRPYRRR
jgi:hypothetical protein